MTVKTQEEEIFTMNTETKNQRTITQFDIDTHLLTWLEAFIVDDYSTAKADTERSFLTNSA